jgi:hypothetical protein
VAEIVLFHHAQGLAAGVLEFAEELRAVGHVVHASDLYDGKTFADLDDGVGYAREVGFDSILERGRQAAECFPNDVVYGGFSLGVMPAQMLPSGLRRECRDAAQGAGPRIPGGRHVGVRVPPHGDAMRR